MEEPLEHWARYKFDPAIKIPDDTTNYMESSNGKIERFRNKCIMTLLVEIRNKWMSNLARKAELASEWAGKVTPRVKTMLAKLEMDNRYCKVIPAGKGEYSVIEGRTTFIIDLNTRHCDCMFWDISCIPVKHP